uniref:ACB domain-containing protein n=1 Tax=Ascaris lumbricoides TaxID=6252 RepID=A0A0M3IAL9_ASCLU
MDKVVDPTVLVMASIAASCIFMIVVIIVNGVLLCALEHGHVTIEIAKCEEEFVCAIKAAKFAAMPMTAVVALSELSGLTMEQVVGEYDKDSMERRAIIYSVFGRDGFTKEFIETCPKFLQDGYKDEALLLKDKL